MVEPPTSRSTLGESRAASASPDLHVKVLSPTIPMPEWLRIDLGLPPAEPEPTPIERALAILAPHLATEPLYRA
jgi:transposase